MRHDAWTDHMTAQSLLTRVHALLSSPPAHDGSYGTALVVQTRLPSAPPTVRVTLVVAVLHCRRHAVPPAIDVSPLREHPHTADALPTHIGSKPHGAAQHTQHAACIQSTKKLSSRTLRSAATRTSAVRHLPPLFFCLARTLRVSSAATPNPLYVVRDSSLPPATRPVCSACHGRSSSPAPFFVAFPCGTIIYCLHRLTRAAERISNTTSHSQHLRQPLSTVHAAFIASPPALTILRAAHAMHVACPCAVAIFSGDPPSAQSHARKYDARHQRTLHKLRLFPIAHTTYFSSPRARTICSVDPLSPLDSLPAHILVPSACPVSATDICAAPIAPDYRAHRT
ncbi:hypothetical protein C8R45DRAFT_1193781 [Mycena sanguinolenta]|nr:hypothetical protein C8R45DRAFT_1193781 [Mycena sanguinolenta]